MPEPVRVVIVDDEPPARAKLRRFLAADPRVTVAGEAGDGEEAVSVIEETRSPGPRLPRRAACPASTASTCSPRSGWLRRTSSSPPLTTSTPSAPSRSAPSTTSSSRSTASASMTRARPRDRLRMRGPGAATTRPGCATRSTMPRGRAGPLERFLVRQRGRMRLVRAAESTGSRPLTTTSGFTSEGVTARARHARRGGAAARPGEVRARAPLRIVNLDAIRSSALVPRRRAARAAQRRGGADESTVPGQVTGGAPGVTGGRRRTESAEPCAPVRHPRNAAPAGRCRTRHRQHHWDSCDTGRLYESPRGRRRIRSARSPLPPDRELGFRATHRCHRGRGGACDRGVAARTWSSRMSCCRTARGSTPQALTASRPTVHRHPDHGARQH